MLERHGIYHEYDWFIVFTDMGHRCGYVSIPKGHPLYEKSIDDLEFISCHGGITYVSHEIEGKRADDEWIIGFDCCHYPMDAIDIESVKRYFGKNNVSDLRNDEYHLQGHIWTANELEEELEHIIDQIIKYEPKIDEDFLKKLDQIEQDFLDGKFKGGKI